MSGNGSEIAISAPSNNVCTIIYNISIISYDLNNNRINECDNRIHPIHLEIMLEKRYVSVTITISALRCFFELSSAQWVGFS